MNWIHGFLERLNAENRLGKWGTIVFLIAVGIVLGFVLGTCSNAQAADVGASWTPVTTWAAGSGCPPPPGDSGPIDVQTTPVSYRFKWGTTQGGPYPNVVSTDQTSVTVSNPFGPGGGTVYAIVTSVVSGYESCPSNEAVVTVDPFVPMTPTLTLTVTP